MQGFGRVSRVVLIDCAACACQPLFTAASHYDSTTQQQLPVALMPESSPLVSSQKLSIGCLLCLSFTYLVQHNIADGSVWRSLPLRDVRKQPHGWSRKTARAAYQLADPHCLHGRRRAGRAMAAQLTPISAILPRGRSARQKRCGGAREAGMAGAHRHEEDGR